MGTLHDRYGRPEMVEATIKKKLDNFPKLSSKEMNILYDLLDILSELESTKSDVYYSQLLSYFDTSSILQSSGKMDNSCLNVQETV